MFSIQLDLNPKQLYEEPMIYFVQSGDDGPIKIGYTSNPPDRMKMLQIGNPNLLHLRAVILGATVEQERLLQDAFWHDYVRGEWYEVGADLN